MNKTSNIYKCSIDREIRNNKEYCYLENIKENDINKDLDKLFNSLGPLYRKKVIIKTKLREFETYVYKRNKETIMTKELEIIPIKDIISLKRIS